MFGRKNASELAARVRSLIGGSSRQTVRAAAENLCIAEGDLREIVEHETPYPSVSTLAALVAWYGVDAGWLLTGEYTPATHRAAEDGAESERAIVRRLLRDATADGWAARSRDD